MIVRTEIGLPTYLKKNDFEDEDTENDTEEVFVPPTPIYQAGDGDPSMNSSF